jgi:hypothetical protein
VWFDRHGLASYDYADILMSPGVRRLTLGNHFAQRVAIQFGKRFPFNIRPLLGIAPHVSSQTLALICSARAWQCAARWPGATLEVVRQSAEALLTDRLTGNAAGLWGMKLHFASRFVQASPTTPNLFQTSNAVHALLDSYHVTGTPTYVEAAQDAVLACLERLGMVRVTGPGPGMMFCRYYPGMKAPVYNVNALLAAACLRLGELGMGDSRAHATRAEALLRFVLAGQRPDGAWPYAATGAGPWVDGYHTGYVLEALGYFAHLSGDQRAVEALERGLAYFRDHLLDPDLVPKYFDNSRYPIDVQNCAQGIQTIARLQRWSGFEPKLLRQVVERVVSALFLVDATGHAGFFAATRGRHFVNRTPYVRWGQAPMLLALTFAWVAERGAAGYMPPVPSVPGSAPLPGDVSVAPGP